jgi:GlpG protein
LTAFYYHFIKPFMRVIETSLDEDLSLFSRFLWQNQVRHRIFEERGRQVVEVAETATAADVRSAYEAWRRGELVLTRKAAGHDRHEAQRPRTAAVLAALRRYPVLIAVLGVSLAVFPFSVQVEHGRLTPLVGLLTSVDLERGSPTTTEIWRYVTPIFLHFSLVHLVFNVAVTADLGRRVELARGSLTLLLLIVVIAIASNAGQLLLGGNPLFGGLSGVAYGLLGYVLVSGRRHPQEGAWRIHPGFAGSLLLFLVVFSTGITEPFGLYVANQAHWVGLATGAGMAVFLPLGRPGD